MTGSCVVGSHCDRGLSLSEAQGDHPSQDERRATASARAAHAMPHTRRGAAPRDRRPRPSSCTGAFPLSKQRSYQRGAGQTGGARASASAARATAVVARPVPWHARRRSRAGGQRAPTPGALRLHARKPASASHVLQGPRRWPHASPGRLDSSSSGRAGHCWHARHGHRRHAHLGEGVSRVAGIFVRFYTPTVSLDVISLMASSCGYYKGQIEHRVAH